MSKLSHANVSNNFIMVLEINWSKCRVFTRKSEVCSVSSLLVDSTSANREDPPLWKLVEHYDLNHTRKQDVLSGPHNAFIHGPDLICGTSLERPAHYTVKNQTF